MRHNAMRVFTAFAATLAFAAVLLAPSATAAPVYPEPDPDPFYSAPADLGALKPGDVIRFRRIDTTVYGNSTGWQVAFRSTNSTGAPIVGVTTVMLPPGVEDPPLLSYQAIVNSLGTKCSPSRGLFNLELADSPGLLIPISQGWAVSVPDHTGPTGAYGAARLGGMITLDSIRAVQRVQELGLDDAPVALAGYSGGGMASAWAAALAPTYAPELEIAGVVAGGVPADLNQTANLIGDAPHAGFGLAFAGAVGLEREYPERMDVAAQLNDNGMWFRDFVTNECRRFLLFHGAFRSIPQVTKNGGMLATPEAVSVLNENSLRFFEGIPNTPVYFLHGKLDPLTPFDAMAEVVQRYCAAGARVVFRAYEVAEHQIPAAMGFEDAFNYIKARFRGEPAPSNC